MSDWAMLIARLFLGAPFVLWGYGKLRGGEAALAPGFRAMGLPDPIALAYLVGLCEFVGGVGVVLGYPARSFSVLLGLWCLITGYEGHRGDRNALFEHACMAGGFFALAAAGPGAYALFGGQPTGVFGWLR